MSEKEKVVTILKPRFNVYCIAVSALWKIETNSRVETYWVWQRKDLIFHPVQQTRHPTHPF